MTIPKNQPLSAFPPQFDDLLRKGCMEVVEIPCDTPAQAQRLRMLMNRYRTSMRAHHGDKAKDRWEPLYNTVISIRGDANRPAIEADGRPRRPSIVVLSPRHGEFANVLGKAKSHKSASVFDENASDDSPAAIPYDPLVGLEPE